MYYVCVAKNKANSLRWREKDGMIKFSERHDFFRRFAQRAAIPAQACAGLAPSVGEIDELFMAAEQNKRTKNLKILAPIFSSASSPSLTLALPCLTCASARAFRRQLIGCCGVCVDAHMFIAVVYCCYWWVLAFINLCVTLIRCGRSWIGIQSQRDYRCIDGLFYFVPLLMRPFDAPANRG